MTAPLPALPPLTEKAFQAMVVDLARLRGWMIHHQRPAMTRRGWRTAITGDDGFPDLVLARPQSGQRPGRLQFLELKTETGRLRPGQERWASVLAGIGGNVEYQLVRPADWPAIERALA